MSRARTSLMIGTVLVAATAACGTASAAKRHHAYRHTHHRVYSNFGRFDPDNYGIYGGPETGFFAGPSYGPTGGYRYE